MAQKEAFQLKNQQVHRVVNELVAHQQRYDQMRENMANEMHREAGVVAEQIEARWRQECQAQKTNWEQECLQLKLESQRAQGRLVDRGRQDQEEQLHFHARALTLQMETTSLIQERQAVEFERQAAHQAGLRAREMELQAQQQIAELGQ